MTRRRLALALAPLAIALLVAVGLLWSRGDPSRQGGFCSNATVAVTDLLRRTERADDLSRDQAGHLAEALGRLDLLDGDRLTTDVPHDLTGAAATVRRDLRRYQAAFRSADGGDPPAAPAELSNAVGQLLRGYYDTCL